MPNGDNIVEQLNSSGAATARYTQGLGIDEPMEVYEGGKSYYYHADGLGSVVALTKSTGTAANTYFGYNTFGGMPNPSETVSNPFRFTAREFDSETGLYYYRARYYDSLFGRFLSEDPLGYESGQTNLYVYAANSPSTLNDPFGLRPGQKYHTLTCAGWNAVLDINQTSRQRNREWGGWMYRNRDGTYSYVAPVEGGPAGMRTEDFLQIPAGATIAGLYHTHGAFDPNMNAVGNPRPGAPGYNWHNDGNEAFSNPDKRKSDERGPGFLGTPRGTTEEYVPRVRRPLGGRVRVLTQQNCGCEQE